MALYRRLRVVNGTVHLGSQNLGFMSGLELCLAARLGHGMTWQFTRVAKDD